eukprot:10667832-Alexandrium_andersonii.AAC.1
MSGVHTYGQCVRHAVGHASPHHRHSQSPHFHVQSHVPCSPVPSRLHHHPSRGCPQGSPVERGCGQYCRPGHCPT